MPFNVNHKRHLLATFQHMDKLLAQAVANLGPADGDLLFPASLPDATPTQRQVIADYLSSFRSVARRFLETAQIHHDGPTKSGLWSLHVALNFVGIALAEMDPKHLSGYGALEQDATTEIERALAQLEAILRQLSEYLERGLGGDIAARLAKLDQTRTEVALLQELERVVSAHGLVEFRATLSWLLDRFEHPWLEVAFFGRVSCGKSSLVNSLLGRDVLPTGVTPVTAVPTRIVPGDPPCATVWFAQLPSRQVDLVDLADFATEERNPGNQKRVVDILVELPARRLADGVCFVDTPGLGSLATAGAAQSLAYLPRCDIGVLLIDAAGSLTEEDISVARAILESGAILIPVLSKADLLSSTEIEKLGNYVRGQLRTALGMNPGVSLVTVKAASAYHASEWFERELAPRLRERRALLSVSLRRKVGGLREAVVAALSTRMGRSESNGRQVRLRQANAEALADARSMIAQSRKRIAQLADKVPGYRSALIDVAALALANAWTKRTGASESGSIVAFGEDSAALSLAQEVDRVGGEFAAVVEEARQGLERALASAAELAPSSIGRQDPLPSLDARPLFDPQHLFRDLQVRPGFRGLLGPTAMRANARSQLLMKLDAPLTGALEAHSSALKRWAIQALASLEKAFDASVAAFSAIERLGSGEKPAVTDEANRALQADLELLHAWEGVRPDSWSRDRPGAVSDA